VRDWQRAAPEVLLQLPGDDNDSVMRRVSIMLCCVVLCWVCVVVDTARSRWMRGQGSGIVRAGQNLSGPGWLASAKATKDAFE
jgi:hypothetical protein